MYWNEIKRIASAAGFFIGLLTLAVNLMRGHTLLHSAYTALLIMIASSILFLLCLRGIGNILTGFLLQKKMEAEHEKKLRAKELAKEKLEELKVRRQNLENRTRKKLHEQAEQIQQEKVENLENTGEPIPEAPATEEKMSA